MMQLAVSLLVLMPLLWPVTEFFDRWDSPGLDNDIEITLFAVLFLLCLVLLLTTLLARLAPVRGSIASPLADRQAAPRQIFAIIAARSTIPHASPPLRI